MAGVAGRVALVTGAGSAGGIGFATARLLKEAGARVGITSTTDRIFERLSELPGAADDAGVVTVTVTGDPFFAGHWKLDDGADTTAVDSSGNGNDGTLVNGPVWTAGTLNGALAFDGSNDYVSLPNTVLDGASDVTVAFQPATATTERW